MAKSTSGLRQGGLAALLCGAMLLSGALLVYGENEVPKTRAQAPLLEGVDLLDRNENSRISILVEIGEVTSEHTLLRLGTVSEIQFEITSGPAEFVVPAEKGEGIERVQSVRYLSTNVVLPALYAGTKEKESILKITVNGNIIGSPFGVAGLQKRVVAELWRWMKTTQPAILYIDPEDRYVIADLSKLIPEELPEDVDEYQRKMRQGEIEGFESGERIQPVEGPQSSPEKDPTAPPDAIDEGGSEVRCPVLMWYRPKAEDEFPMESCNLNLRPYARLEFYDVPNPATAGYSVKLESVDDGSLVPAQGPAMNGIDGLYKKSWGCNIAFKIPNNNIAKVYATNASCCRGLAALFRGRVCTWLDPRTETNWANCPL